MLAPSPPVRFITPKAVRGSLPRPTERVEERVVGRFSGMAGEVGGDCTDHVREHGGGLAAPGKQHVLELDLQWAARKVVDVRAVLTGGAGSSSGRQRPFKKTAHGPLFVDAEQARGGSDAIRA